MEKVTPLFKSFKTIFYLKFFEQVKVNFKQVQFEQFEVCFNRFKLF
jgi:hypothetical protein